jgi:hypothetical protein
MNGAAHGGEGMACAGHGVVTPSPSRPSLTPGGVAPAARRPRSGHALPTWVKPLNELAPFSGFAS